MLVRVTLVCLALCLAPTVQAQDSRLDEVAKRGALRVCTPGDYKPFSLAKADGTFEGLDVDLVASMAKSLGVEAKFVKTSWPKLMDDFVEKCDIAVGGISVTLERQKRAFFTAPYMVNGKAPITKCENVAKFQTVADINAGTYRELVEAAEACQVAIIHPGKPRNPNEPGLAELLKRAEAFN